jgi:hypothetical protein
MKIFTKVEQFVAKLGLSYISEVIDGKCESRVILYGRECAFLIPKAQLLLYQQKERFLE